VYSAKEKLFEEQIYERLFRKEDVAFYLTRYWLLRTCSRWARGKGTERTYMKLFVAHTVWDRDGAILRKYADGFIRRAENSFGGAEHTALEPLEEAIGVTYDAVARFYRETRSKEDTVYSFFKRIKQYDRYIDFMSEAKQEALRLKLDKADDQLATMFAL
jgi:hypothetical protein